MSGGLLVVGDVVTDVVARHGRPLAVHTDTAARITVRPGGAGANVAAWAALGGAEVRLLGRVGADSAEWHRAELVAEGVQPHLVVDPEMATAVVIALVDGEAERTFVTDSGATARLGADDWNPALLDGVARVHLSGYLYFTGRGRELASLVAAAAERRGLPVSVDPASTGFIERLGVEVFTAAVGRVGLVVPNLAEARLLTGDREPERAAARLADRHGEAVVKLGAAGAVVAVGGEAPVRVRAVPADRLVDTTGAGDAFTGAYLAARLAGAGPEAAARAGCGAGAAAVAVVGGRPPRG